MRNIKFIILSFFLYALIISCNKDISGVKSVPISSITIVNALVNSNSMIADLTGADSVAAYYSTTEQIGYGSFFEFSIPSGITPAVIYQVSDTNHSLFKSNLNLQSTSIYTLFLSGIASNQNPPDTLLTLDHPPYHSVTDSTVGIRFVNLSPASGPISVNIQGYVNGSEVTSLAYRNITEFKNYPAIQNITSYTFEIRDVASGDSLTSITYNLAPFQNITIAVIGQENPSASLSISTMQVNNY